MKKFRAGSNMPSDVTFEKITNLMADIITDNNSYDFDRVIYNDDFIKTGKIISMAKGWNGIPDSYVDYIMKYGIGTVDYVMKTLADQKLEKGKKKIKEKTDGEDNEVSE